MYTAAPTMERDFDCAVAIRPDTLSTKVPRRRLHQLMSAPPRNRCTNLNELTVKLCSMYDKGWVQNLLMLFL
jgi:hypothetical protein